MMQRLKKSFVVGLLAVSIGVLGACDSDDGGEMNHPDAAGLDATAAGEFLAPCTTSNDCILGLCVDIAGEKRCSKPCGDEGACPALEGWACTESACRCSASMAESTCASDRDCDGVVDVAPVAESCNQRDDDCNGEVDDVAAGVEGAARYFPDGDGDGFGDANFGVWACAEPEGYVDQGGDCNDDNDQINPDMVEICGDPHDNDCDTLLEDPDVCGLPPLQVADVLAGQASSMHDCSPSGDIAPSFDIIEITAAQDSQSVRFVVRLEGGPATQSCSTYKLSFGDATATNALIYLFRPGFSQCASPLPRVEAHDAQGALASTGVDVQFNAEAPGSVSFIIPRAELFSRVPDPSYWVEACTIEVADGATDLTACSSDRCAGPIHR